ncbi:thioredoxin domain-containing protein [Oligoflexus tunisiensis]|uniref:thioredoxin domain-containing protein n=1 Tax=Oligoflexus tunisiensis TaxID=708132 RepID=UPI000AA71934|nr:thioredoxin domain-containing protein [Oligoflexus tunisiensis]
MRFIILSIFLILLSGCVTTRSVATLAEVEQANAEGELLLVEPAFAQELLKAPLSKPLLLEFYADWCGPCQTLRRPLQRAARDGKGRYLVAKVDVSHRPEVMDTFGMRGSYPSFILRAPGNPEPLRKYGADKFEGLVTWLKDEKKSITAPLKFSESKERRGYKAVLVAGSSGNANFIQELYFMQRILVDKGLKPEEVACFAAAPDFVEYHLDKEQFESLKPFIQNCRLAKREAILATIQTSINQNPDQFYLYVSSHGAAPVPAENSERYKELCLSQAPALVLDEEEEGCQALQDLTPDALAAVMMSASATKKYIILQGCYTGGFISTTSDPAENPSSLAALPRMTILTASRPDRTSFGCHPGWAMTIYGYAVIRTLAGSQASLDAIPWAEIARDVDQHVQDEEKKFSIPTRLRSHPQFFQNP